MGRLHWTREQKQDFWAAFVRHRDEGCSIKEAWSRAYADFRAEGKIAPGLRTFGNWYRKAMAGAGLSDESADAANNRTHRTYRTYKENAGTDEAARDAGEVANEEAEEAEAADAAEPETADDYVRKLEAMLRLYRRRSEADVDAFCDYLLPDLCAEEE